MNSAPRTASPHTRPTLAMARITDSRRPRDLFHMPSSVCQTPRPALGLSDIWWQRPPHPGTSVTGMDDPVSVEHDGPVTTVVLRRPHARNAVDGPTARALADAFRAFDADESRSVAVLYGDGGTFCSGADLKAIGTDAGNRVDETGDG